MSEQVAAPAEAVDPFEGKEVSFEEFSNYRKTGEVPERIKAEAPKDVPPVAQAETVDGEEPAKEAEQEQKEPERNEKGQFKAKEKSAEFSPEQQQVFDRAFSKREAKIRREYEALIADLTSKQTGTAPDKPTTQPDAPPKRPELPKLSEFAGTLEEFDKQASEYPARLAAFLESERLQKEKASSLERRVNESAAKVRKTHPDYDDELKALQDDIKNNEEPGVPEYVIKAIAEQTDDPHGVTYYLAKNREEFRRFASLSPEQAVKEAIRLDTKLALQAAAPAPDKKPAEPKPKPPAPVGGRASATAFDVNDESMTADEWVKQRWKQARR